jgi:hypothetical protein
MKYAVSSGPTGIDDDGTCYVSATRRVRGVAAMVSTAVVVNGAWSESACWTTEGINHIVD